ncbi:MAG TPA: divalent cation transporter [Nitrososphaera sp.]
MEQPASVSRGKMVASAVIPLVILGAMIGFLLWPGNSFLNFGTPLPEITVERIEFGERLIIAHIRNTGPETIDVAQADVNDRIRAAAIEPSKTLDRYGAARVVIPYDWNEGQPYEIGITTSDGTRFAGGVEAATMTPRPDAGQVSLLALLGTYVGIIPVMIGLLWLPFLRQLSQGKYMFFLSLTAGLLLFLGIDAVVEANEISAATVAGSIGGAALIATVAVISFLGLLYISERLVERSPVQKATITGASSVALMIAVGIGLHNLGEGLAIGGAMVAGEVALSTFLIIGFTLHNTTEGLAIVAPVARQKPRIAFLALLGFIAGAPAIAGAWIGGFIASPIASVVFLAVGAGAVFQVVYAIFKFAGGKQKFLSGPVVGGIAAGMLIMYLTALLI